MITDLDKNKSGNIDFEEFLDMMTARMSDKDTREDINKVFRLFDDDTSGSITIRNLRRVARELGETMTDEELQEMVERADSNGDGAVSMDDFYNIMTKKTFVWLTPDLLCWNVPLVSFRTNFFVDGGPCLLTWPLFCVLSLLHFLH